MKKLQKLGAALLVALALFCAATTVACNETKQLVGISVDGSSIAKEQVVGEASLNGLKLTLHFKGSADEVLTLTDEDFSAETLALLNAVGEQTFTVHYLGFTDTITLTILPTETPPVPNLSAVRFSDKAFFYDGTSHTLAVENLPQGVTVSYTDNARTEIGSHEVTAVLLFNGKEVLRLFATITVAEAETLPSAT